MARQVIVVLDTPPLEADRWAARVFADAGFDAVDNARIAAAMADDADTAQSLRAHLGDMPGPIDALAGRYRNALHAHYGDSRRLGLYGTAWLRYLDGVDACIVDWSEVERRATARGVRSEDGTRFREQAQAFVHQATDTLPADAVLELDTVDADENTRVERALAFLRGRGLA